MMANDEGVRIILRAEVDAEVERLRAENAALREIVEAVADYATLKRYMDSCEWCGYIGQSGTAHAPDCPVTKARTLLVARPREQGQES